MNNGITGPLFKWFGSKWNIAKHYPAPKYSKVIEPYAGSAGYSLRHYTRRVHLAERNLYVYRLWRWLINVANEAMIREIPINLKVGTDIKDIGLNYGQELLLKHWQRTNNVGTCWTISPWGNSPGQWTANTRARVASEVQFIKHWKLISDDARDVFTDTQHRAVCTWFIDPPYEYNYDYGEPVRWYRLLSERIKENCKGQVIVCEAVCPKTKRIPDWLPFKFFRESVTSRRKQNDSHHSKELIYYREN